MLAQEIAPTEIGKHANIIRGKWSQVIENEKKKKIFNSKTSLFSCPRGISQYGCARLWTLLARL